MNSTEYFLAPRVDETCTGDKEWYSCSVGDYKGCCSSNPCTTGSCPDDDAATASTETKATKTSTKTTKTEATKTASDTTTTTSTSSSLSTFHTTTSSVSSTSTSVVQITHLHESTTVTAATSTSTSTNKSTQTSNSSNHGAIIGGIIGSIAGLLVIILVIFCIRRRKRSSKDSYALGFKPKPISATDTHYIGYSGSDPATSAFYSRSPIDYRCKHLQPTSYQSIPNIPQVYHVHYSTETQVIPPYPNQPHYPNS
ncbi:hypothetical protein N7493_001556 [Penicillium malachiteum]|uniref:Mid2 domain-containing protein n=1 Tax=Penicillium malachiteum TaxID=1324776 RepID=A0AAD6HUM4_9EURO|nr:hypothetical protein N7493_001556 [Penicillium malachiteum]